MVELVENMSDLQEHARFCRDVLYRVELTSGGYRLRVRAGRFAWDGVVDEKEKDKHVEWLRSIAAIKVIGAISDEVLFI